MYLILVCAFLYKIVLHQVIQVNYSIFWRKKQLQFRHNAFLAETIINLGVKIDQHKLICKYKEWQR